MNVITQLLDRSTCTLHRSDATCYVCGHCVVRSLFCSLMGILISSRPANRKQRRDEAIKAAPERPLAAQPQVLYVPVPVPCLVFCDDGSVRVVTEKELQLLQERNERFVEEQHAKWQQEMLDLAKLEQRKVNEERALSVSSQSPLYSDKKDGDLTTVKRRLDSSGSLPSNCHVFGAIPSVVENMELSLDEKSKSSPDDCPPGVSGTHEMAELNIADLYDCPQVTVIDENHLKSLPSGDWVTKIQVEDHFSEVQHCENLKVGALPTVGRHSPLDGSNEESEEGQNAYAGQNAEERYDSSERTAHVRHSMSVPMQEVDHEPAHLVIGREAEGELHPDMDLANLEAIGRSPAALNQAYGKRAGVGSGSETITSSSEDERNRLRFNKSKNTGDRLVENIEGDLAEGESDLENSPPHASTPGQYQTTIGEPSRGTDLPGGMSMAWSRQVKQEANLDSMDLASFHASVGLDANHQPGGAANGSAAASGLGSVVNSNANVGAAEDRRVSDCRTGGASSNGTSCYELAYENEQQMFDSFALDKQNKTRPTLVPCYAMSVENGREKTNPIDISSPELLQDINNSVPDNGYFEDTRNKSREQVEEIIEHIDRHAEQEQRPKADQAFLSLYQYPYITESLQYDAEQCESLQEIPKLSKLLQNSSGVESESDDRLSVEVQYNASNEDTSLSESERLTTFSGSVTRALNDICSKDESGQSPGRAGARGAESPLIGGESMLNHETGSGGNVSHQGARPKTGITNIALHEREMHGSARSMSIGAESAEVLEASSDKSFNLLHEERSENGSLMAEYHPVQGHKRKASMKDRWKRNGKLPVSFEEVEETISFQEATVPSNKLEHNYVPAQAVENHNTLEVFVVYQNHQQIEAWVLRVLKEGLVKINGLQFTFLHKALEEPGRHKTEFVVNKLRTAYKVLVVLSTKFLECKYCRFALQTLVPSYEEKVIPITAEICDVPIILQHITFLGHNAEDFWGKLASALLEKPIPGEALDGNKPPRPFIDGQEPFLLLWHRPSNPVEPHFQHSVGVPSTPDRRNDHRVVFRIGFFSSVKESQKMVFHDFTDKSKRAPSYEVRMKINTVYKFLSSNKKAKPEAMLKPDRVKCVRFWKDIYRQPKTEEELKSEIGFWLRLKNPTDAHKIIAYLTFDLLISVPEGNSGTSKEYLVHSLNLDFETKAKKSKIRPRDRQRRQRGSDAGDEDDDFGPRNSHSEILKDFVITMNEAMQTARADGDRSWPTDGIYGRRRKPIVDAYSKMTLQERHGTGVLDLDTGREQTTPPLHDGVTYDTQGIVEGRQQSFEGLPEDERDNYLNETMEHNLDVHAVCPEEDIEWDETMRREEEEEARLNGLLMLTEAHTVYPKPGLFRKKKYHDICYNLELLAECARDDEGALRFHAEAERYFRGFAHKQRSDERIVILLKQSGVEHYRNHLSAASDYVRQALDLLPTAQYRPQMEARIYYYISSIYREKKKFGKAKYWIKRSKEMLKGVEPGEDTAKAFYNEGRLYMKILMASSRHEECRRLAVKAFDNCLQHAKHDYEKYGTRLDIKVIRRCFLNMARIYVDMPELPVGRAREIVTLEDLQMAKACIDSVRMPEYWGNPSLRNKAHLLLAESGFFYRKAEMLNRMVDEKHRENARKNLNTAVIRAREVLSLNGIDCMKEFRFAEEFILCMEATNIYVRGVLATDWLTMRNHLTDLSTSSDDPEVRSETVDQQRKQAANARFASRLAGDKTSGDDSDVEL